MWLNFRMLSIVRSEKGESDWVKVDLHIHTLDDPKDAVDYSAHQLRERAQALGFRVLAITLHDAVFDRPEVCADAAAMGILLIYGSCVRSVETRSLRLRRTHSMSLAARLGRGF